jgi:hypothetical protein
MANPVSQAQYTSNSATMAPSNPATIKGTGTAAQVYPVFLNIPGSNRINGQTAVVRIGGSVFPNTASNVKLQVSVNYPAGQYAAASITSASMANNVALYNGTNNFVVGQYVTVANIANANLNGTVGPITVANATAFSAANVNGATLAIANIANAAQTASAAIGAVPLYTSNVSPTLTINVNAPFKCVLDVCVDSLSGILNASGSDQTANANGTAILSNSSTGTVTPVPGINVALEPAYFLTVSHTFGTSDANNAGTVRQFLYEG